MAITIDPETGEMTTTFLIEMRRIEREREHAIYALNRNLTANAISWRVYGHELIEIVRTLHHYRDALIQRDYEPGSTSLTALLDRAKNVLDRLPVEQKEENATLP